ncbi:hypothetical protein ACLOJK_034323 [Asimina triloba]
MNNIQVKASGDDVLVKIVDDDVLELKLPQKDKSTEILLKEDAYPSPFIPFHTPTALCMPPTFLSLF